MRDSLLFFPQFHVRYMLNYGVAAVLVADLRESCSSFLRTNQCYDRLCSLVFRHGCALTSNQLILNLLGRPLNPDALCRDIQNQL